MSEAHAAKQLGASDILFYALIQNEEDDGNLNKKIVYLSVPSLSQAIS